VLAGPSTGAEEEMHGFRREEVPLSTRLLELVGRRRGFVTEGRRGCGSICEVDQSSRADKNGR
jgi:hypothetical protein